MRIFSGLIMVLVGTVLIVKTEWFIENFGSNAWAEAKLGTSGGTRMMYKILGLIIIFFGMLVATNMIAGFLNATIVSLFTRQ